MKETKETKKVKQKIFLDADDVLLNSSEVVIEILNKRYNINPPKGFYDIRDWGYKSIYKDMTKEIVEEIFASEEFWNNVKLSEDFLKILSNDNILHNYNWCIVTKGNRENLNKKYIFFTEHPTLSKYLNDIEFYGLEDHESKSCINMEDGIQVDDNASYLDTNAKLKMLMLNFNDTEYNNIDKMKNRDDIYRINTFEELGQILEFNLLKKL